MSFFANAQGFEVNNSYFTTTTTTDNSKYLSGSSGINTLREASALEAMHDSSSRTYSPRCFPGTREQYIQDIIRRATPPLGETPLPIYWMRGPAGVGKTAIAQACAEELQGMGALGATFFFSLSGQRKPEKFFPTIAYQLSTTHPAYYDVIDRRISHDSAIISKALRFQFRYLIEEPLRELEQNGRGIRKGVQIIVDGLDECEETEAQCEIIRIVATSTSDGVLPLRWTFFSRPAPHIKAMFSRSDIACLCYKAVLPISRDEDGEIELYLRSSFKYILQHRNAPARALWPSEDDIKTVVRGASGSFIYATTVIRFVGRTNALSPQKRLRAIVDVIQDRISHADTRTEAPFAELDAFYTLILKRIPAEVFPSVHLLLALMYRYPSLSAMLAANVVGLSQDEFETVYSHVNAVIWFEDSGKGLELDPATDTSRSYLQASHVFEELYPQVCNYLGGRVGFYHSSFYEFLRDPKRSGSYCAKYSGALAKHYVQTHLKYDQTFRWSGSELVLAPDVRDSADSLSYSYTENELVNSLIKAYVYTWAGGENSRSFPTPQQSRMLDSECDFRKHLYIYASLMDIGSVFSELLWGCECQKKNFGEVYFDYISPSGFSDFNVIKFRLMIKHREQMNVIRLHHRNLTSRLKSFFFNQSRGDIESALYCMGHGEKSVFWYWEINHKSRYYRSFHSVDLAKGEKKFREEDFDSWPRYRHEYEGKG